MTKAAMKKKAEGLISLIETNGFQETCSYAYSKALEVIEECRSESSAEWIHDQYFEFGEFAELTKEVKKAIRQKISRQQQEDIYIPTSANLWDTCTAVVDMHQVNEHVDRAAYALLNLCLTGRMPEVDKIARTITGNRAKKILFQALNKVGNGSIIDYQNYWRTTLK